MIFVTVGTQLAFDRLIGTIDEWAGMHPSTKVIAQVGPSKLLTKHIEAVDFLSPSLANQYFGSAEIIIAHAGMGSVLTALNMKKPLLIMPRKASLGEHRNEHQLATARWLKEKPGVYVAEDESELLTLLDRLPEMVCSNGISKIAPEPFTRKLCEFIHS